MMNLKIHQNKITKFDRLFYYDCLRDWPLFGFAKKSHVTRLKSTHPKQDVCGPRPSQMMRSLLPPGSSHPAPTYHTTEGVANKVGQHSIVNYDGWSGDWLRTFDRGNCSGSSLHTILATTDVWRTRTSTLIFEESMLTYSVVSIAQLKICHEIVITNNFVKSHLFTKSATCHDFCKYLWINLEILLKEKSLQRYVRTPKIIRNFQFCEFFQMKHLFTKRINSLKSKDFCDNRKPLEIKELKSKLQDSHCRYHSRGGKFKHVVNETKGRQSYKYKGWVFLVNFCVRSINLDCSFQVSNM